MHENQEYYQDFLEWEYIDEKFEITNIEFENGHYSVNQDAIIKFSRNDRFKLVATMTNILPQNTLEKYHGEPGTFIEKENIIGTSRDGEIRYKIIGIVMGRTRRNYKELGGPNYQANIIFDSIEKTHLNRTETVRLTEWYLSSKPSFNFPRITKRTIDISHKIKRYTIDTKKKVNKSYSYSSSNDFLLIKSEKASFIVSNVPDKYLPEWSSSLLIEYRTSFGEIPNANIRESVAELMSFILGNKIIKIGESEYNEEDYFTNQKFRNPESNNTIAICQANNYPPIPVENSIQMANLEPVISNLLDNYLSLREKLVLGGAISKFWVAKYSSLGANLPILSSALESLSENYLKSHEKVKPYYIDYDEFEELIKEEIKSISEKLANNIHKEIIVKKIKQSSQRSLKDKLERMFENLDITIGKIEWKAINARNKMAHTSFNEISEEEVKDLIRLTRAYETLFNRVILKMLGHTGKYIDYYTLGFPQREMDEHIPN